METSELYAGLDGAYAHFNRVLFKDSLPSCIMVLSPTGKSFGTFSSDRWQDSQNSAKHEISLNPDTFKARKLDEILSTLVHEMCHLQQQEQGKPSTGGHHNKEWGSMMLKCGLIPSNTGKEGGKRTGRQMTHYIEQGGAFIQAYDSLIDQGFALDWASISATEKKKAKGKNRICYQCPKCDLKVWGKPQLKVGCVDCSLQLLEG